MTPLEHYREAERLLNGAQILLYGAAERVDLVAAAQVHATLANAHMTAGVWEQPGFVPDQCDGRCSDGRDVCVLWHGERPA